MPGSGSLGGEPMGGLAPTPGFTPPAAPHAPASLTISVTAYTQLTVTWSAPGTGGPVSGYAIRIGGGTVLGPVTSPYTFSGLTPGTSYTIEVQSVGAGGYSSWSSVTGPTTTAPPYVAAVLALSPLAYYRLNETSSLVDTSPNARHGTFTGGSTATTAGFVVGDSDQAVAFTPPARGLVPFAGWMNTSSWTVVATIKQTGTQTGGQNVVSRYVSGDYTNSDFAMRVDNGTLTCFLFSFGSYTYVQTGSVGVNVVTNIAFSYDATTSTLRAYFNGNLVGSSTRSRGTSNVGLSIGGDYSGNSAETYTGVIDEVAFFGTALSDADIGNLNYVRRGSPPVEARVGGLISQAGVSLDPSLVPGKLGGLIAQVALAPSPVPGKLGGLIAEVAVQTGRGYVYDIATTSVVHVIADVPIYSLTSTNYTAEVLAKNPGFYYKLEETSGTSAVDSSPNARHGTYVAGGVLGQPGLTSGVGDKGYLLPGAGRIELANAAWMNTSTFSCVALIRPTIFDAANTIMSRYGNTGFNLSLFTFRVDSSKLTGYIFTGGSAVAAQYGTNLVAGTIYHVAMTYNGTQILLYLNGLQVASQNVSSPNACTLPLWIGARSLAGDENFKGTLDELSFFPGVVLTPTQITNDSNAFFSPTKVQTGSTPTMVPVRTLT